MVISVCLLCVCAENGCLGETLIKRQVNWKTVNKKGDYCMKLKLPWQQLILLPRLCILEHSLVTFE